MAGRILQRDMQIVDLMALGAIAHAELDPEIDADPDKQHRESDRDRIERSDQGETHCGRYGKANEDADQHGRDDPGRAQRQPQNADQEGERYEGVERGVLLQRSELLVLDGDRAGEADARAILALELEVGDDLADHPRGRLARLKRREIKDRPDLDNSSQLTLLRWLASRKLAPR